MSTVYLVVAEMNLVFIGLLPHIFFDAAGRKNLMWWVTAAPFFAAAALLVAFYAGVLEPWYPAAGAGVVEAVAAPFACVSIALIAYTIGTHRVPLALWHQEDDAPRSIVTWGAYRYVRHPFYTAFLLALTGIVIGCPHPALLACLAYAVVILHVTALREERRLSRSELGEEYRGYLARTGRFLPRLGGSASA